MIQHRADKDNRSAPHTGREVRRSPRNPLDGARRGYSVAALLYFLLTGQAPFQTGDIMATMACIVSEDPPSVRSLRPDVPQELDHALLTGLSRDRQHRWQSMGDFRQALLPFLPTGVPHANLASRTAAMAIDFLLILILVLAAWQVMTPGMSATEDWRSRNGRDGIDDSRD
jgi:hypothetical protein